MKGVKGKMDSRLKMSEMTRSGMDSDDHGFVGESVVFVGDAVDGDEGVGFGEGGGGHTGAGNGIAANCGAFRVQPMIFYGSVTRLLESITTCSLEWA